MALELCPPAGFEPALLAPEAVALHGPDQRKRALARLARARIGRDPQDRAAGHSEQVVPTSIQAHRPASGQRFCCVLCRGNSLRCTIVPSPADARSATWQTASLLR